MSNVPTELVREIQTKLPAGQLDMVCKNAPEGTNADGVSYKELCQRCLVDTSADNQKACVAGVVAGFVHEMQQPAAEQAPKADTSLNAVDCNADPTNANCLLGGY